MKMLSRREVLARGAGLVAGRSAPSQPSQAPIIRTVLKDVAPESFVGATLFHKYLSLAADLMRTHCCSYRACLGDGRMDPETDAGNASPGQTRWAGRGK